MNAQQLKNSILQLAVQGKLVPQDPNDEPASVLVERIRAEKERLIKEKKIKKDKNPSYIFKGSDNLPYEKIGDNEPICIAEEVPFEIPDSWEWVRLEECTYVVGGKKNQIKTSEILEQGLVPVVSQGLKIIDGYCNNRNLIVNDLPLVMFGDHTRNVKYINFPFIIGADGTKFHKCLGLNSKYLYYWMLYSSEKLRNRGYARHYSLLKMEYIPLPPLAEQERIVNKIKELEPYIKDYDIAYEKIEKLNKDFPEQLKKSILQDAVQGKLVPQDENDEPASVLIEKIRQEKTQLIKEKKIKKDKNESYIFRRDNSHYEKVGDNEPICIDSEIPFDIPDSWEWVRLSSIINLTSGQDLEASKYNSNQKGIPYITGASNIENEKILINRWTDTPKAFAYKGNLLLTCKGTVGAMAFLEETKVHIARQIMAIRTYNDINLKYFKIYMESYINKLKSAAKSMIPGISRETVLNIIFPLPPLAEQQRIVEKVEQLLPQIMNLQK